MGVFNLEKLALLISSRMGTLLIDHQRCSRVRSPLSNCSYCTNTCPVDALSFSNEGIDINRNCIDCGLCAGVCPTGALITQEPTELALLDKLISIDKKQGTAIISCRPQKALAPKGVLISCMGCLSWELLLALDAVSFPVYVVQSAEKCVSCPVTSGGEQFIKQLKTSRAISARLGIPQGAIQILSKAPEIKAVSKENTADPSRRAFFSSIFSGAKQVPKSIINDVLGEPVEEEQIIKIKIADGTDTSRLRLLKQALKGNLKEKVKENEVAACENNFEKFEELRQAELASTCYFCNACSILCPLGALKQTEDNQLILDTGKCTGCKLCVEVCVHKSLTLMPSNLNQILQAEKKILAQGIEDKCQKCEQPTISSEPKELCFICERNALWYNK